MAHPLPYEKIAKLYSQVSPACSWSRASTRSSKNDRPGHGLPVVGKELIPGNGELDQEIVFRSVQAGAEAQAAASPPAGLPAAAGDRAAGPKALDGLPVRPPCCARAARTGPCLCDAAPSEGRRDGRHRRYTLGALRPLLCGSRLLSAWAPRVGMMAGVNKVAGRIAAVAVIGDSTVLPLRGNTA